MKEENIRDFNYLVSDILSNPLFKGLKAYGHHGITRYDHARSVAYRSFVIAKALNLDIEATARGALLHDFFFDKTKKQKREIRKEAKGLKKITSMQGYVHAKQAKENATKYFDLNNLEIDIIEKHMFPLNIKPPKYTESWLVSGVDKALAVKEMFLSLCNHPVLTLTGRINER